MFYGPLYLVLFQCLAILGKPIQEESVLLQKSFDNINSQAITDEPEESPWLNTNVTGADKLFEGDMDFGGHNIDEFLVEKRMKRMEGNQYNAINSPRKWSRSIAVPYRISDIFNNLEKEAIKAAMQHIDEITCISFAEARVEENDYLDIIRHQSGRCSCKMGAGGVQKLSLGRRCMSKGTIVHELVHAIGLFHEQSRSDRDDYVEILWDNIMENKESNFKNYSLRHLTHLNTEYDYGSLMHYGAKAFSKNGKDTIRVKHGTAKIGQNVGLSKIDVLKINRLYECEDTSETVKPKPKPDPTKMPEPMSNSTQLTKSKLSSTPEPNPYSTPNPTEMINYRCKNDSDSVKEICPLLERNGYCKNKAIYKLCPKSCSSSLSCKWKTIIGSCTSLKKIRYMFKQCGCACFEYLNMK